MARLTEAQWALLRTQWQDSPLAGFHWMTEAGGGPWRISREGIRRRARAEDWAKRDAGPVPGAWPGNDVDQLACTGSPPGAGPGEGLFDCPFAAAEVGAEDVRPLHDAVLLRHRRDWLQVRRLASAAVTGGTTDAVRRVKLAAELLRAIQEAEERVWELDAERIDFEAMSEGELERCIARGRRAR